MSVFGENYFRIIMLTTLIKCGVFHNIVYKTREILELKTSEYYIVMVRWGKDIYKLYNITLYD